LGFFQQFFIQSLKEAYRLDKLHWDLILVYFSSERLAVSFENMIEVSFHLDRDISLITVARIC